MEELTLKQFDLEQDFSKRPKMVDGWWQAVAGIAGAVLGAKAGSANVVSREWSEDEKALIDRMEQLSQGNPEIGQLYSEFTKKAFRGEAVSPGLEKDIAEQEAKLSERIQSVKGLTAPSSTTTQAMTGLRETGDIVRDTARRNFMQLGEQLLASRANRMMTAAGGALEPLAKQREDLFQAQLQTKANKASVEAGRAGLVGQTVGQIVEE